MAPALLLCAAICLHPDPAPQDSTYATARVRQLVAAAAVAQARPPATLTSFAAHVEAEIGLLVRDAEGEEVPGQIEQLAGRVTWRRDGSLVQRVTGYRVRSLGVTLSTLSYMRTPWVFAPLYGDRVAVGLVADSVKGGGKESPSDTAGGREAEVGKRRPLLLVQPFATDRAEYYRFAGGDTVLSLQLPERTVRLVRITVEPRVVPADALVFRGDIDLDAERFQIVRMRGQLLGRPGKASALTKLLSLTLSGYFFIELENAEWEGYAWLPYRQRIELQVGTTFSDERAIIRLVTSFSAMALNALPAPADSSPTGHPAARALEVAPADSLRGFAAWRREPGAITAATNAGDFDDVAPDALRPGGPPRLHFSAGHLSNAIRYDRVEGLFTGLGARLDLRDAAPGGFIALHGGYAWAESTLRGAAQLGMHRPAWEAGVVVQRRLTSTNDFPRALEGGPTILGLFGADDFDYVDRYSAGAHFTLTPRGATTLGLAARVVRDRAPVRHVSDAPLGGDFLPLRPVDEGSYGQLLVSARFGGQTGGEYLAPGVSGGTSWELAWGGLDWQRVEAFVRDRNQVGPWVVAGALYGGAVFGDPPPPQALFELGSRAARLPGFDYKAFTGDRAAVAALQAMYMLPVLNAPLHLGRLFLPPLSPAPALELHAGWTGAASATAGLLERNGWTTSDGVRATLFLGIRVFGGAMSLGLARPLGQHGVWRFEWGMDPGV